MTTAILGLTLPERPSNSRVPEFIERSTSRFSHGVDCLNSNGLIEDQDRIEARRRELKKSISQIEEELRSASLEEEQTQSQIEDWNRNWNELLAGIALLSGIGGPDEGIPLLRRWKTSPDDMRTGRCLFRISR